MSKYTAEFRELTAIYHQTESRLNSAAICDTSETGAFADSILRQCDCLANIERMNAKVDLLCDSWKRVEFQMDLQSRNETRTAMAEAKAEALRLKQVCESHRMKLEAARERLGAELGILGKRTQHLKSIQPIKNNYPKFIDSLC